LAKANEKEAAEIKKKKTLLLTFEFICPKQHGKTNYSHIFIQHF
jgi:hypothetical protein